MKHASKTCKYCKVTFVDVESLVFSDHVDNCKLRPVMVKRQEVLKFSGELVAEETVTYDEHTFRPNSTTILSLSSLLTLSGDLDLQYSIVISDDNIGYVFQNQGDTDAKAILNLIKVLLDKIYVGQSCILEIIDISADTQESMDGIVDTLVKRIEIYEYKQANPTADAAQVKAAIYG